LHLMHASTVEFTPETVPVSRTTLPKYDPLPLLAKGSLSALSEAVSTSGVEATDRSHHIQPAVASLTAPVLPTYVRAPDIGSISSGPTLGCSLDVSRIMTGEPASVGELTIDDVARATGWTPQFVNSMKVGILGIIKLLLSMLIPRKRSTRYRWSNRTSQSLFRLGRKTLTKSRSSLN
jgi:hypothetical protein